jgi:hypothetical protein
MPSQAPARKCSIVASGRPNSSRAKIAGYSVRAWFARKEAPSCSAENVPQPQKENARLFEFPLLSEVELCEIRHTVD